MSRATKIPVKLQAERYERGMLKWNPSFEATVTNTTGTIGRATLTAEYDKSLERYVTASLTVERIGEGGDITGAVLRDMRIAEALQLASLENIWVEMSVKGASMKVTIDGTSHVSASDALASLPSISGRTTDQDAQNATIAYAIAQVSGMPALRTIGEALKTSQSTAKRLVARARELGYIDG